MQARTASLSENISTGPTQRLAPDHAGAAVSQPECTDDQEDEDMDVPEILEEIIEMLLSGLRDTVCFCWLNTTVTLITRGGIPTCTTRWPHDNLTAINIF